MQNEHEHFSLQGTVDIFGCYVVLKADLCQMLAKDISVLLIILLCRANHLHSFENHGVGIFLDEGADDCAILEVAIKVGESTFLKEDFCDCLFAPEEENVLGLGAEVRELQIVGRYIW